jgi:uncharacterized protein (TIGR02246 family)
MILSEAAGAVRDILERSVLAWANNDGAAFADLYSVDATVVLTRGVYLRGRDEIRASVIRDFAGRLKGASAIDELESMRIINDSAAIVVTLSAFRLPDEAEIPAERWRRATWVLARASGTWLIEAYSNTPVSGT